MQKRNKKNNKLKSKVKQFKVKMSLIVSQKVLKAMENMVKEAVRESILACAEKYGFDGDAEVRHQLEKAVVVKAIKAKGSSEAFPLPFIPSQVKEECCQGLKYNRGLFTQCLSKKGESSELCKTCMKGCCGTVSDRLDVGLMEYKDSKGRKPVAYMTVLKRMKKSDEEVDAFVKSFEIPEEHLVKEVKTKEDTKATKATKDTTKDTKRGRPKKGASVVNAVVEEEANLMDLMSDMEMEKSSVSVVVETEGVSVVTDMKKEKNEDKELAKEQKKQEALAKKELKKQEAEQKKELKKQEKELKKQEAEQKKQETQGKPLEDQALANKPKAEKKEQAKKYVEFEFEGKKYRNEENIIYAKRYSEEHKKNIWEEAGVWDEVEKKIVFDEDEDDVSEESESDEETE